jgi:hypothetical protein
MKKISKFLLCLPLIFSLNAKASDYICTIYSGDEQSTFYCIDSKNQIMFDQSVEPISEYGYQLSLEDQGVEFVSPEVFAAKATQSGLTALTKPEPKACYEEVYYRSGEFNKLPSNHAAINSLKELAKSLHSAGVCNLPVSSGLPDLGIKNSDDILEHFLCISNSESVFGTRNIGQGGRGPWGIHPMHNQKAGTRAFTDGKTVTLKKNGVCYPGKAVVRDASGKEIKDSKLYMANDVRLDNAKCAMTLYKQGDGKGIRGFKDWGTGSAWGSNRHCTKKMRTSMNFGKFLGELSCCSASCKSKYSNAKEI